MSFVVWHEPLMLQQDERGRNEKIRRSTMAGDLDIPNRGDAGERSVTA